MLYESKLTNSFTKTRISNLFTGSGGFHTAEPETFDALIVDEAHRLNAKSGLYRNLGENQIKELIAATKVCIFFLDEDQRVTLDDIGEKDEIRKWASQAGARVTELALESQFRCNGSDGYLAWVDNLLQIRETANSTLEGVDYSLVVCDTAVELRDAIEHRNRPDNKARIVAGYCWDWASKKQPDKLDIVIPSDGFAARWNLTTDGSLWILKPDSVKEVGCIHTCQGLEVDFIGVIFGEDLVIRDGVWIAQPHKRSTMDSTIRGYKSLLKIAPEETMTRLASIIKNTYRTLMTRGQKGCYLYSVDAETNKFLAKAVDQGLQPIGNC